MFNTSLGVRSILFNFAQPWRSGSSPVVAAEARKLAVALPGLLDRMSSGQIVTQIGGKHSWSFVTRERVRHFFAAHCAGIIGWATDFGSRATMLFDECQYHHSLVVLLFLAAWRLVQDYVNSPHIIGEA
jgi:hypothetical protein